MGRFDSGRIFIALNRGDYWQCGYVIAKGQFDRDAPAGIETFRAAIVEARALRGRQRRMNCAAGTM